MATFFSPSGKKGDREIVVDMVKILTGRDVANDDATEFIDIVTDILSLMCNYVEYTKAKATYTTERGEVSLPESYKTTVRNFETGPHGKNWAKYLHKEGLITIKKGGNPDQEVTWLSSNLQICYGSMPPSTDMAHMGPLVAGPGFEMQIKSLEYYGKKADDTFMQRLYTAFTTVGAGIFSIPNPNDMQNDPKTARASRLYTLKIVTECMMLYGTDERIDLPTTRYLKQRAKLGIVTALIGINGIRLTRATVSTGSSSGSLANNRTSRSTPAAVAAMVSSYENAATTEHVLQTLMGTETLLKSMDQPMLTEGVEDIVAQSIPTIIHLTEGLIQHIRTFKGLPEELKRDIFKMLKSASPAISSRPALKKAYVEELEVIRKIIESLDPDKKFEKLLLEILEKCRTYNGTRPDSDKVDSRMVMMFTEVLFITGTKELINIFKSEIYKALRAHQTSLLGNIGTLGRANSLGKVSGIKPRDENRHENRSLVHLSSGVARIGLRAFQDVDFTYKCDIFLNILQFTVTDGEELRREIREKHHIYIINRDFINLCLFVGCNEFQVLLSPGIPLNTPIDITAESLPLVMISIQTGVALPFVTAFLSTFNDGRPITSEHWDVFRFNSIHIRHMHSMARIPYLPADQSLVTEKTPQMLIFKYAAGFFHLDHGLTVVDLAYELPGAGSKTVIDPMDISPVEINDRKSSNNGRNRTNGRNGNNGKNSNNGRKTRKN